MILSLENLKSKYDLKIKGVLHIGAHFGQEYEIYEKLGINNLIFFEPVSSTFRRLKNNIGGKAILLNTALGNMQGQIEMFIEIANEGQSNSILSPEYHLVKYPGIIFRGKEKVTITKLDNFIKVKDYFNFINIDVQGYELEVFKGSINFLKNIDYILTEVNKASLYKNCPLIEDLDIFLSEHGFTRVETEWFLDHNWGDAFYIKKNLL